MRIISSEGIEVIDLINEINKSYHNLKIEVRNLLKYQFISKFDKFNQRNENEDFTFYVDDTTYSLVDLSNQHENRIMLINLNNSENEFEDSITEWNDFFWNKNEVTGELAWNEFTENLEKNSIVTFQ